MSLTISDTNAAALGDKIARQVDERSLYLEIKHAGARLWRLKSPFQGGEMPTTSGAHPDVRVTIAPEPRDAATQLPVQATGLAAVRPEEAARETAARLAAMTASTVRVSVTADGTVEICKGRAATRLTPDEARAVKELLIKLTA